ncbi:MAG: 23S rRNA (adenine(2503)-C(2))-methyltransferase RlmN [Clostridiales bacterium]|jgi:23S rRNA (adenine2503-C2)-methyltransferase|nr:23S rRNA (adenine(2503)-C(2))-methyltransferase RlmN [Clostridiales bacterium]
MSVIDPRPILLDSTPEALAAYMPDLPGYRIKQLYAWLTLGHGFATMSDLPLALRTALAEAYIAQPVTVAQTLTAPDGTQKYLFSLAADAETVEGVAMGYKHGTTLCLSTQVGCRMGCSFCSSGLDGLLRNLTPGEMLGEAIAVNALRGGTADKRAVTNLVLMGMGEPLDNYDNVVKFLRLVSAPAGLNISQRNISLSTCGIVPAIHRLADEGLGVNLTISLHATTDEARARNMPVARAYPLSDLIAAARAYFDKTGRRVIFEYVMLKDENMSAEDVTRLSRLLRGFPAHVNLIMLNPGPKRAAPCSPRDAYRFLDALTAAGLSATIRRSMGGKILGACGQLRRRAVGQNQAEAE